MDDDGPEECEWCGGSGSRDCQECGGSGQYNDGEDIVECLACGRDGQPAGQICCNRCDGTGTR